MAKRNISATQNVILKLSLLLLLFVYFVREKQMQSAQLEKKKLDLRCKGLKLWRNTWETCDLQKEPLLSFPFLKLRPSQSYVYV